MICVSASHFSALGLSKKAQLNYIFSILIVPRFECAQMATLPQLFFEFSFMGDIIFRSFGGFRFINFTRWHCSSLNLMKWKYWLRALHEPSFGLAVFCHWNRIKNRHMSHLKRRRDISSPYCNSNRIAYATLQSNFLCLNLMSSRIDAKSSAFLFTSSQVLLAQTWASTYTRFIGAMNLVVAFPFSSISICFFFKFRMSIELHWQFPASNWTMSEKPFFPCRMVFSLFYLHVDWCIYIVHLC